MGKKLCALNKTVLFGSWSNFIGKLVLFFATRRRSSYVCYSNGLDYVSGLWNPLESRTAEMFVCDKLQCHFEIRTRGARKTISGSTYQNKPGLLELFLLFLLQRLLYRFHWKFHGWNIFLKSHYNTCLGQ